jgi:hypothetical protein
MAEEDRPTPPEGHRWRTKYELSDLQARVAEHEQRLNAIRALQIEAFGADGRHGFVRQLFTDAELSRQIAKDLASSVDKLKEQAVVTATKLAIVVALASAIGSAIVGWLLQVAR